MITVPSFKQGILNIFHLFLALTNNVPSDCFRFLTRHANKMCMFLPTSRPCLFSWQDTNRPHTEAKLTFPSLLPTALSVAHNGCNPHSFGQDRFFYQMSHTSQPDLLSAIYLLPLIFVPVLEIHANTFNRQEEHGRNGNGKLRNSIKKCPMMLRQYTTLLRMRLRALEVVPSKVISESHTGDDAKVLDLMGQETFPRKEPG